MDKPRPCGCKGRRTCLICEENYGITKNITTIDKVSWNIFFCSDDLFYYLIIHHKQQSNGTYVYCPSCNKAWPGWDLLNDLNKSCPNHIGKPIPFPGVYIKVRLNQTYVTTNTNA